MRDRLVELIEQKQVYGVDQEQERPHEIALLDNDVLADHLLANGVIVPPCKVGQTIYVLTTDSPTGIEETKISQVIVRFKGNNKMQYTILAPCVYDDWGKAKWSFCDNDFGKTVFLTREEAEKALKERSNENAE
jgi:hypothetical protein